MANDQLLCFVICMLIDNDEGPLLQGRLLFPASSLGVGIVKGEAARTLALMKELEVDPIIPVFLG